MTQAYVGFYWTLKVPRRPNRIDTTDVTEAARRSRTIRYQHELVRRFVNEGKGRLIGEAVFFELQVDRSTEQVADALAKAAAICSEHMAKLIFVDFSLVAHWRPHDFMMHYLREHQVPTEPLWPDEIMIDARRFDPAEHFRLWKLRQNTEARDMRFKAKTEFKAALIQIARGPEQCRAVAEYLNARDIPTATGRRWTIDGVRKTRMRNES